MPVGGGRGGLQRGGGRGGGLAGVQLRLGVAATRRTRRGAGSPGPPRSWRPRSTRPGRWPRPAGSARRPRWRARPGSWPRRVVGERGTRHLVHPGRQARRRRPRRPAAAWSSRRARACSARSAQARMPAASSRPQKIVRSAAVNSARTRWTSSRASPGRPAHSASSAARCPVSRAHIDAADLADARLDLLPPPGGRLDVAAQQVDLGAALMHQPVIAVGRPGGQRVDQRRRLGRAPAGEQRLGCVGSQRRGHRSMRPGRSGGRPAGRAARPRQRRRTSPVCTRTSLSVMASHSRACPPVRPGPKPAPGEGVANPSSTCPRRNAWTCEARQAAGDHGGGAGCLGDLQRAVHGREAGLQPPLGMEHEDADRSRARPRRDRPTAGPARTAAAPP